MQIIRLILTTLLLPLLLACSSAPATKTLTILHFNDVYQYEPANSGKTGGAARFKTLINQNGGDKALLLFSGDALGGSRMSRHEQGKAPIQIFNAMGVDDAVFGNHDFDFGAEVTTARVKESAFTWIGTNLRDVATGKVLAGGVDKVLKDRHGVKVGIIGIVEDWRSKTHLGEESLVDDMIVRADTAVKELKAQGAELIIALTHMFMVNDEKLATGVPDIDLILGGHDHEPMEKRVGSTLIWKTGSDFIALGRITAQILPGQKPMLTATALPVTDAVASDTAMATLVASWEEKSVADGADVFAESEVELDTREHTVRLKECPIGNLITDALRDFGGTDVALINGGGIRSSQIYPPGPLTKKTLLNILPFANKVVAMRVSGANIRSALENGIRELEDIGGAFPHVSGMSYTYDASQPVGRRILSVKIANSPLDDARTYTLTTLDYVANGGEDYLMFKDAPRLALPESDTLDVEAVAVYLKKRGIIAPSTEGRIVAAEP